MINITDKTKCVGCGACAQVCRLHAIEMVADFEGFFYPNINKENCIDCGACDRVCPVEKDSSIIVLETFGGVAYAAIHADDTARKNSSSGGAFFALASNVLRTGGVVVGASFNRDCTVVSHSMIESIDELDRLMRSKYVQSDTSNIFKKVKMTLQEGKQCLFSGTPCQVEALKKYLGAYNPENLITVDIFCHGVPSPGVWKKYIEEETFVRKTNIIDVNFRNKDAGWKKGSISIFYEDGSVETKLHNDNPYMVAFKNNSILRPSCHHCSFKKINHKSDISLGDLWGCDAFDESLFDNKGTSAIIVHTLKGRKVIQEVREQFKLLKEVNIENVVEYNKAFIQSEPIHPKRNQFFAYLSRYPVTTLSKRYAKPKLTPYQWLAVILQRIGIFSFAKKIKDSCLNLIRR